MKIVPIFVSEKYDEGLHSIQYEGQINDEFQKIFNHWHDPEYLLKYCQLNQADIFNDFWGVSRLEDFVEEITNEVYALEAIFLDYAENGFSVNSGKLQSIFRPLNNYESKLPELQFSKAKVDDKRYFNKPKLRLYALRVSKNSFIVTGGCIKLVHRMEDSEACEEELNKLERVKAFLKRNDYITEDDIVYYYDQSK